MKKILSFFCSLLFFIPGALCLLIYFGGCSYSNVDDIKANAANTWGGCGFEVVGYEGYQIGSFIECPGGRVWYIVRKKDNHNTLYHGFISKFSGEYHVYELQALDAIAGAK